MLNSASFCMSTYVREMRPPKTEAGSDTSLLFQSSSILWCGGKTESGLHLSQSQRLRVCLSAWERVSVWVRAYLQKQLRQSSTHTTTVIDESNARNMHLKLRAYTSYIKYSYPIMHLPNLKLANDMYIYSHANIKEKKINAIHRHDTRTSRMQTF
jgi:hypothetical protein